MNQVAGFKFIKMINTNGTIDKFLSSLHEKGYIFFK